ncbi:MAG: amino acid adenylation domain-containing protein, partial [Gammaproteobacteria bacterium]|nr:amino acid adenylation domain-containing protein [Gammaproteobacteria bacterium]
LVELEQAKSSSAIPLAYQSRPGERYQPFPLTDIQQAYWLGRKGLFDLGNVACHSYFEVETTNLDLNRLTQAWQTLIHRHDMLRAIVLPSGQQQILEASDLAPYEIKQVELTGLDSKVAAVRLDTIRQEMSHQVLSADQWPLFDIRATQMDQERTRLHLSLDLLITDLGSIMILLQEWTQLYQNPGTQLPELSLSFRDYVLTEKELESTELYQQAKMYWLNRLDTLPSAPELPLLPEQPVLNNPQFTRYTARLEANQWARLKERAGQAGLTPSGMLLAAFADILAVWSRHPRFSLNLTLFNRLPLHPEVQKIVGDFTTTNLLAIDHSIPEPFIVRARRIQQQLWQDLEHRHFNGVRVLREMSRQSENDKNRLMPVVFTSSLGLGEDDFANIAGLGEQVYGISQTPQVWLDHQVFEQEGALLFNWDVIEELFPSGLLKNMFESYCRWLNWLVTEEMAWTETRPDLLPESQLSQRKAVNATQDSISEEMLHTLFMAQMQERAEAKAIITPQGSLTYQELYQQAKGVGYWLRERGAKPNHLIAVVMEKGWEQVVAVLGILMSGAAYVPIAPELPAERRQYLLEQTDTRLVLTHTRLNNKLDWPENIPVEYRLCVDNPTDFIDTPTHHLESVQNPTDLAYIIYTSGSTGLPKGVMIDHRGAVNTILDLNKRFEIGPSERVLALSALNFDLSVYDIFGTLAAGGTIVIPAEDGKHDPAHWVALMTEHHITLWNSVPTLMQMLVEYLSGYPDQPGLSTLRLIWLSGDWIPVTLPAQVRTLWAEAQLISLGGATEASIWSILYPIEEVESDWSSIPYGKPMRNQSFHVFNERMEPCPVWAPGQLYIGGIGLAQGYWRDEEKSKASFISHPHTGEWLYKSGDLGRYLPDGNI